MSNDPSSLPTSDPALRGPAGYLVAHRGEPTSFPENSLSGYRAVLAAGACFVETDVHVTRDGVAVLSHDPSLRRICGVDIEIAQASHADIRDIPAGYAQRFGDSFAAERIATLDEFVLLLRAWPGARAFVEIKTPGDPASIARCVASVLHAIQPAAAQCIPISFDVDVLACVRARSELPIGWVLPEWSDATQAIAADLRPEFLFVGRDTLPAAPPRLWPGAWRWVLYTVNVRDELPAWRAAGFALIETDRYRALAMQQTGGSGQPVSV